MNLNLFSVFRGRRLLAGGLALSIGVGLGIIVMPPQLRPAPAASLQPSANCWSAGGGVGSRNVGIAEPGCDTTGAATPAPASPPGRPDVRPR